MTPAVDVVIVGGGIAGLAAAYELHRQDVHFVLCESRPRVGGVIMSDRVDDCVIDAGPDSLLVQKVDGIRLCEELGLGARLVPTKPPRQSFVQRGGRLHPIPAASVLGIPTRVGPFVRTKLFSVPGKLRMAAELFVPYRAEPGDESIGAFMTRRFGVEATTYLAEPLLAGIHAGEVFRLSASALFPRFVEAERQHGSLLRAFRKQAQQHTSSLGAFRSLPGGLEEMVSALTAALPARALRLGSAVERVSAPASGVRATDRPVFRIETAAGDVLEASAVILAAPAYVSARLIREMDPALSSLCAAIPYASTATVALAFPRSQIAHPLNGSGFVVPRVEGSKILAASWLSSKWPGRAPEGLALLRAFAGGARDPGAIDRDDNVLIADSLNALRPLLGITGAPLFTRVYRWERANAQHEVGHPSRLAAIETAVRQHRGLFVTGSGFRGVGIPDCVADARTTAREAVRSLARETSVTP